MYNGPGSPHFLSVAYSPNGKTLAAGDIAGGVMLWNVQSKRQLSPLVGNTGMIVSAAFAPEGHGVLFGVSEIDHHNAALTSWDLATISPTSLYQNKNMNKKDKIKFDDIDFKTIAFSKKGRFLASTAGDGAIWILDVLNRRWTPRISGDPDFIYSLAFSPKKNLLVSGGGSGFIRMWDIFTGREMFSIKGYSTSVESIAISPDGNTLISADWHGEIKIWNIEKKELMADYGTDNEKLPSVGRLSSVHFREDGHIIGARTIIGSGVELWDLTSLRMLFPIIEDPAAGIGRGTFSPDGHWFAVAHEDGTTTIVDCYVGLKARTLVGHLGNVSALGFSPDSKLLISGSWDGTARVWDVSTGRERAAFVNFLDGSWIVATPEGYFESSSALAEDNLNVRIGDRVFGISSFRENFNRPDLVKRSLAGESIAAYGDIGSVKLSPEIDVAALTPDDDAGTVTLKVRLTDGGGGLGSVRIFDNDTGDSAGQRGNRSSSLLHASAATWTQRPARRGGECR